jgi:hypothetical protein
MGGNMFLYSDSQVIPVSVASMPDNVDFTVVLRSERMAEKVFTADTSDVLTSANHGISDWTKCKVKSDGTLPSGLSVSTDYYAMDVDTDTLKLTEDLPGTVSPSAVDITASGVGTHKLCAVSEALTHDWHQGEPDLAIDDTIADLDLAYNSFAPEVGDLQWQDGSTDRPRFIDGECRFRLNFPAGTYLADEDATVTVKVASDSKLMGNSVTDLDVVIKFE